MSKQTKSPPGHLNAEGQSASRGLNSGSAAKRKRVPTTNYPFTSLLPLAEPLTATRAVVIHLLLATNCTGLS
jgi:hypothetical protein